MNRIATTARALALASLVALLATAVAQGMNHARTATPPGTVDAPMGMGMPMNTAMATQPVDEASFLVHMIPHHREAVTSAEALRAVTQRPELLALLDAIVTSQTAEIEAMEDWLDAWHPDVDRDVDYAPMMRDLGPDADVAGLERAFLEDMIVHHMMAVHEAQTLLVSGLAEHDEVAALARSIVADQMGEMHQMAAWLRAWFGVDAMMGMGARQGATHGSMHGFMRGGATLPPTAVRPNEIDRLVRAFLSGQGVDAGAAILEAPSLVYEVTVRLNGATQVLRVDAATGTVTITPAR